MNIDIQEQDKITLLTPAQAASYLGINTKSIYKLVKQRELEYTTIVKQKKISVYSLKKYIKANTKKATSNEI